ncbi:peptidoglycan-associated lipoprotein Pal [bacterium]|nr:peptidoglycan-associated lipoprotein Pal [bacterium]
MKNFLKITLVVLVGFAGVACQAKKSPESSGGYAPSSVAGLKTVYYDYDDSTIRSDQVSVLDNNASVLKGGNKSVTVEGHCDERGTNEYNLALGDRRARSAKNYLINRGVDPSSLNVVSFGEEKPACSEHDESCWWQNRRAEFVKF